MAMFYRIHPGIGIARVGPSEDGYFLAGDTMSDSPFELDGDGKQVAFTGYKDVAMLLRRQAARFRVFEYERNEATGVETLKREITAAEADITWSVHLVAAKASTNRGKVIPFGGQRTMTQGNEPRNPGVAAATLRAEVTLQAKGKNFQPTPGSEAKGTIRDKLLYIGEARTDNAGRLLVLPGYGKSATWNGAELVNFYDNPGWYDDIADGPVDATLRIGGIDVQAERAWVISAPPDFAPDTLALTSLYDLALDAARAPLPARWTYPQDIKPFFDRAAGLAQVNEVDMNWLTCAQTLAQPDIDDNTSTEEAAARRQDVYNAVLAGVGGMQDYALTGRQKQMLEDYLLGQFSKDADGRISPTFPQEIDRASLDRCVGGGFFPGIEAGHTLRLAGVLSGMRFSAGQFTDWDNKPNTMTAGLVTGRMACPWQADFIECAGNWWPAQRPDIAGRVGDEPGPQWARKLVVGREDTHKSRLNMVTHFGQLGLVTKNADGTFTETGRDARLDQLL